MASPFFLKSVLHYFHREGIQNRFPPHLTAQGATTTTAVTHIAIQEALDGKVVDWLEPVSDEQYQAGLSAE